MAEPAETIWLPSPKRGGWRLMLLVSLLLMGFGAKLMLGYRDAADQALLSGGHVALGVGMFLGSFALLMLFGRETGASIEVLPERAALRLSDGRGAQADIPAASLLRAIAPLNPSDGRGQLVTLQKRDGGLIELAVVETEEEAGELVAAISGAVSRLQQAAPERGAGWGAAAVGPLPEIRGVTAKRADDGLSLQWSAGSPWHGAVAAGCPAGFGLMMLGFVGEGGALLWLAVAACFALALVIVATTLFSQGVVCRVRVDDGRVVVEQLRFGKVTKSQELPLAAIASVDYTHQLNATAAALSLRREPLDDTMAALEDADNPKAAFTAALQLMQGVAAGVQLPCARLSLASKVGLDMLLSREVARRSGRMPSEL